MRKQAELFPQPKPDPEPPPVMECIEYRTFEELLQKLEDMKYKKK